MYAGQPLFAQLMDGTLAGVGDVYVRADGYSMTTGRFTTAAAMLRCQTGRSHCRAAPNAFHRANPLAAALYPIPRAIEQEPWRER